jgi:uncharacterized protein (DUF1330 family)
MARNKELAMPAYVVVNVHVKDPVRYENYKQLAQASIPVYGGRYLARGAPVEVLEGEWTPSRLVILEFPSAERARAWWASTEYAEGKALRQATAHTDMVLTEGL